MEKILNHVNRFLTSGRQTTKLNLRYLERKAVVSMTIRPYQRGQVRFRGSYWLAVCEQDIVLKPGTFVLVLGEENIPLLVEPLLGHEGRNGIRASIWRKAA